MSSSHVDAGALAPPYLQDVSDGIFAYLTSNAANHHARLFLDEGVIFIAWMRQQCGSSPRIPTR